jgi:hypothetical protein
MNISFVQKEGNSRRGYHRDDRVKDIAEILLEEGNVFVKDVAIILTNSQDINQLTNISSQIIRKWRRKLEKDHT